MGGGVLAGAERQPRLDGDTDVAGAHGGGMRGGMDDDAPGAHRLQPALAERRPVGVGQAFDPCRAARRCRQRGDARHQCGIGFAVDIGDQHPVVGPVGVGFVDHERRRIGEVGENLAAVGQRLGLGAGAGQSNRPAGHAANLSSRRTPGPSFLAVVPDRSWVPAFAGTTESAAPHQRT